MIKECKVNLTMGIGDWGLGIGPIPNPQSPLANPQSPIPKNFNYNYNIHQHNLFMILKNLKN